MQLSQFVITKRNVNLSLISHINTILSSPFLCIILFFPIFVVNQPLTTTMNITTPQLQAIRAILSKKDKEFIAEQASKSPRTVEAVLQGDRVNDEIERLALKQAKANWANTGPVSPRH